MPTKAELQERLTVRTAQLDAAEDNAVDTCTLRRLSCALLDRISEEQETAGKERDALGKKIDTLAEAYTAADRADDMVIELEDE